MRKKPPTTTCYAPPPPDPKSVTPGTSAKPVEGDGVLARWAELGRTWRAMGKLAKGERADFDRDEPKFRKLQEAMDKALDGLNASPELRILCQERAQQIFHYELGAMVTCYMGGSMGGPVVEDVFAQGQELERLVDEGRLTRAVAEKAAHRFAVDAELMVQSNRAWDRARQSGTYKPTVSDELGRKWKAGTLKPNPAADLAGKRAVELAVDGLGMLAGPPTEDELPKPKPKPAEESAKEGAP
jgi:hypothetical protein